MAQNIAVIGTGYVGLVAAVGLADFGNRVIGVDIDKGKIETLKLGKSPIYEPGIEEYLNRNLKSGRLSFSTDVDQAVQWADVIFIAVGTPSREDGSADLSYLWDAAETIADNVNSYKVVVVKSTVPVGTNRKLQEFFDQKVGKGKVSVVSNPEFLREGKAVYDFFHPDRVVVGYADENARNVMVDIYEALYLNETPFVFANWETAELIKYASNAFLATKITFINQMANLAEEVGADIHKIAKAMGMDGRISPKFLHPGPGYGGSCFPKDTKALVHMGKEVGVDMSLVKEVIRANEMQKLRMVDKAEKLLGNLQDKIIAIWGLAFKAETDDMRESPAIVIINELIKRGAKVNATDPKAIENAKKIFGNKIDYFYDEFDAAKDSDMVMIVTEWNQYRNTDLEKLKEVMRGNVILDARNVLDPEKVKKQGFVYEGVGRK